jgi:hypothetical protein
VVASALRGLLRLTLGLILQLVYSGCIVPRTGAEGEYGCALLPHATSVVC